MEAAFLSPGLGSSTPQKLPAVKRLRPRQAPEAPGQTMLLPPPALARLPRPLCLHPLPCHDGPPLLGQAGASAALLIGGCFAHRWAALWQREVLEPVGAARCGPRGT